MTKENKPEYYTILPAEVRFNKKLPAYARLLYGDILVLAQKHGYCFAGNQVLADYYEVSKETISKWIAGLINQGYLKREVIRDSNNQIIQRRLYIEDLPINPLEDTPINSLDNTPKSYEQEGINQMSDNPINQIVKDSITSNINNTSINNIVGQTETKERIPYKQIIDHLNKKANKRFNSNAKGNRNLIQARWNEGHRLEDFKQVVDNMVINWSGQVFNGTPAENYLQPSTLFGNKFDKYLNQMPDNSTLNTEEETWDYRKEIGGYDNLE